VLKEAAPLPFNCAVPKVVDPSRKITLPVGTVEPDWAATVAVRARFCPAATCDADAERVVAVEAADGRPAGLNATVTCTDTALETELESEELPP
jgi:hypothetical protein